MYVRGAGEASVVARSGTAADSVAVRVTPFSHVSEAEGRVCAITAAGSREHSCGLATDGSAYCCGHGYYGALGDGTAQSSRKPVRVAGGRTFAAVDAGQGQSCGITTDGALYCWGRGYDLTPVPVVPERRFTALDANGDAGNGQVCAVSTGRAVYCWAK